MPACQRSRAIDTNQPVSFCSGYRCAIKIIIFSAVFQIMEPITDRLICHRGDPETTNRFAASGFIQNPARHKLSFSASICSDNDIPDILSKQLSFNCLILFGGLTDDHEFHLLRHHRQSLHIPFHIFFIIFLRICKRHKMSKCPCHHVFFSLQNSVSLLVTVENSRNIPCYRWFLCNYQ